MGRSNQAGTKLPHTLINLRKWTGVGSFGQTQ